MVRGRDTSTTDLFRDYEPQPVVARFESEQVRAWSMAARLSKAVALTLENCSMSRVEVAKAMSEFLKEEVSKAMLDNYASQAKDHAISAARLVALTVVTRDARALNAILEDAGMIVVPKKYEALMRLDQANQVIERAQREKAAAEAAWKAGQ
jgi:hypothetical protein